MSIQLAIMSGVVVLDHCQVSPVTLPSGSTTSPVIVSPTCGAIVRASVPAHRVTSPISSTTAATIMVGIECTMAMSVPTASVYVAVR